ncbi:hypothetical protein [Limosilactobacillus pontis]|uniref:hypothetical protein n=1 Tax=Limosilactobacillus pontis TaxID=35787 RepID=UPI002248476B|nr:hypothetical protein [Limosilactobacillus pontis]MCX2187111.1 hypothetical protein [Limosilactobacillus pontis]MCX2188915.1 hypothetical protein [Limosilactobacillus pontis]
MQEKWPRQPLIIMPNLPLAWLAGYWVVVTMLRGCGLTIVRPTGDQVELALMVAVVWIVASGANQLLIYQNAPLTAANRYKDLAMVNALALICTIVLAWGKPAVILFPRQLSSLTALMLALTLLVAGIGNYFVVVTRVRHGRLSLWLGSGALALSAVAAPLLFASSDRLSWLLAAILVALIQASVCWQLPRLLAAVPARRSGLYNLLVGFVLAALFASFLLGVATIAQLWIWAVYSRLAICWGLSWLAIGSGTLVIAACQRYQSDFRYGHATGHENWFVAAGALCWVVGQVLVVILL